MCVPFRRLVVANGEEHGVVVALSNTHETRAPVSTVKSNEAVLEVLVDPSVGPLDIERDGGMVSIATEDRSVVVETTKPLLPEESDKAIEKGVMLFASLAKTVVDAVKLLPVVVATDAARPAIVTDGVLTAALEVKSSVMVSPAVARVLDALLDRTDAVVTSGGTVSGSTSNKYVYIVSVPLCPCRPLKK